MTLKYFSLFCTCSVQRRVMRMTCEPTAQSSSQVPGASVHQVFTSKATRGRTPTIVDCPLNPKGNKEEWEGGRDNAMRCLVGGVQFTRSYRIPSGRYPRLFHMVGGPRHIPI